MRSMTELCPFCESHDVFTYRFQGIDFFGCHNCGACVSFKDTNGNNKQADNPVECWNRRNAFPTETFSFDN